MQDLPLAPFLTALTTDGIQITVRDVERIHRLLQTDGAWTLGRLRDTLAALLVKNHEQLALFERRFDEFFDQELGAIHGEEEVDTARALDELQRLVQQPQKPTTSSFLSEIWTRPKASDPTTRRTHNRRGIIGVAALLLVLGVAGISYQLFRPRSVAIIETPPPEKTVAQVTGQPTPGAQPDIPRAGERSYPNAPAIDVANIRAVPVELPPTWRYFLWAAAAFGLLTIGYGIYIWRKSKIPEDAAPPFDPEGPRHFPLGSIGGSPAPILDPATLHELADSMGYFRSEAYGHRLDVFASVEATLAGGGVPSLQFYHRQQVRSLLVLEDKFAEPVAWNPIAQEVATGMGRLGIQVTYGRVHAPPLQFRTQDNMAHSLEDWEDRRQGLLVLIFSDGKRLSTPDGRFALEHIAHFPMVAWMDYQEPQRGHAGVQLPAQYGIPTYPATPDGLVQAVRRFLTEQGVELNGRRNGYRLNGSFTGGPLPAEIEQHLGDALLWGQDCAMIQPISLGLVDALRRRFHSDLPAARLNRLYGLPGTAYSVAGIYFAPDVLQILRAGFLTRRAEDDQEEVLHFLVEEIDKVEPDEQDSVAHLAWEAVRERVHLEYAPDAALARLARLDKTPVGNAVRASLENCGFRDDAGKVPLRREPDTPDGWQRLARISSDIKIPAQKAYRVARGQWALLAALLLATLICAGLSGWFWWSSPQPTPNWLVVDAAGESITDLHITLELLEDDARRMVTSGLLANATQTNMTPRGSYRFTVYGNGVITASAAINPEHNKVTLIPVQRGPITVPCEQQLPELGLTIFRCFDRYEDQESPIELASWRARHGSAAPDQLHMSLGMEIVDQAWDEPLPEYLTEYRGLRSALIQASAVDTVYRIQRDRDGQWQVDGVIVHLQRELGPLLPHSQVLWWAAGSGSDLTLLAPLWEAVHGQHRLGGNGDQAWTQYPERYFANEPPPGFPLQEIAALVTVPPDPAEEPAQVIAESGGISQTVTTGSPPALVALPHDDTVYDVDFSPDGATVVTASGDGTARMWDVRTGEILNILEHDGPVYSAEYSPDGLDILTAGSDGTVRLWDVPSGALLQFLEGHLDSVMSAAFSPDGRRIVTASADGTAREWDILTGNTILLLNHEDWVSSAEFSPDGALIYTISRDDTARTWDTQTGEELEVVRYGLYSRRDVFSLTSSPDGATIVTTGPGNGARVLDAQTGQELFLIGQDTEISSVVFSQDGAVIVIAGPDSGASVWDAQTGEELYVISDQVTHILAVDFSPDGRRLAAADANGEVRIWSLDQLDNDLVDKVAEIEVEDLFLKLQQDASQSGYTGAGLTVAVLGTGLYSQHVDFAGRVVAQYNLTPDNSDRSNVLDGNGDGTANAGIVAANGVHLGMAPGANLAPVKILSDSGAGSFATITTGLDWVLDNHSTYSITVVLLPIGEGSNQTSDTFSLSPDLDQVTQLIRELHQFNIPVVTPAGNAYFTNDSQQGMTWPAIVPETISVGTVFNRDLGEISFGSDAIAYSSQPDQIVPYSQRLHPTVDGSAHTDIFAPGPWTTTSGIQGPNDSTESGGTAPAVVAGAILLLQEAHLHTTGQLPPVDDLVRWLRESGVTIMDDKYDADNVENTGLDYIRIDVAAALELMQQELSVSLD